MAKNKYGKKCPFKTDGINYIDYKDIALLKKYISRNNKIVARYYSGVSLKHQKMLARAIKNARYMGLISYV